MHDEELVEFVRRQLVAEEALARDVCTRNDAHWACISSATIAISDEDMFGACDRGVAQHIVDHDPARVLVDCTARRRLLEDAVVLEAKLEEAVTLADLKEHLRLVKLLLAAPYERDDGWREEYRLAGLETAVAGRVVAGEVVRKARELT